MATSYGFFDAKNLDRVYTAEDFNKYLSGLICNGIFENYGEHFRITANGDLTVTVGTGKAWIDGHYFMSDTPIVLDLSGHVREAAITYVLVGISCDTAENARVCKFEILSSTGIGTESHPLFINTKTKKYLTFAEIKLSAGTTAINQSNITDYRENTSKCGYVKCILGKCGVSTVLGSLNEYNTAVSELTKRMDLIEKAWERFTDYEPSVEKIEQIENEIRNLKSRTNYVDVRKCGENAYCIGLGGGEFNLSGEGATYDYVGVGSSPVDDMPYSRLLTVNRGITGIGNYLFYSSSFETIIFPFQVSLIGVNAFSHCSMLVNAEVNALAINELAFAYCTNLSNFSLHKGIMRLDSGIFTGCTNLTEIRYYGNAADWDAISKADDWIGANSALKTINCEDGSLVYSGGKWVLIAGGAG